LRRLRALFLSAIALFALAALVSACGLNGSGRSFSSDARSASIEVTINVPPGVRADDIAFVREGHIWRAHADGSGEVQLTSGKNTDYSPTWSPTRGEIAFLRTPDFTFNDTSSLCVVSSSGGRVQAWSFPTSLLGVCYSPDGKRIALADIQTSGPDSPDEWVAEHVMIFDPETRETTPLYELRDELVSRISVSWSPDSTQLLIGESKQDFEVQRTGVLTIAAKELEWLPVPNAAQSHWAPDGASILVSQRLPFSSAIAIVEPNGKIQRVLAKHTGQEASAVLACGSYSPDGSQIAYSDDTDIFTRDVDGTNEKRIIVNGTEPAWSAR
jgi:Tol biopolymer transport system component